MRTCLHHCVMATHTVSFMCSQMKVHLGSSKMKVNWPSLLKEEQMYWPKLELQTMEEWLTGQSKQS